MEIAIIAHDMKKELMVQFCIAYKGILQKHELFATGTTGKLITEGSGLDVYRFLSGPQGGDQQIGARIAYKFSISFSVICESLKFHDGSLLLR